MSTWQSLHYLNLLWLLFPLAALFLYAHRRRLTLMQRLAHLSQFARLTESVSPAARFFKAALFLLALGLIITALARPSWNRSHQPFKSKGRDVVFVLDISRSMLAAHRNTTRLEEAKFAIQECLSTVRGDRVALVIFAGNAKVACPLTHDYAYFLAKLNDVDYRSVTYGGTMLGDAIRLVCGSIFKTTAQLYRDVIVITDGEDMESNPVQAAEQLADLGGRLIAVGMGDTTPSPLVITTPDGGSETITDNGTTVMTRLDAETLRRMTEATPGGILIPVPSDTMLNLNEIYSRFIELQVKKDFETHSVITYEEKYQLVLAMAMVILIAVRLIPERRKLATAAALLFCMLLPLRGEEAPLADTATLTRQAMEQLKAEDLDAARASLNQALQLRADAPDVLFNLAGIDYRQERFQEARDGFQKALDAAHAQKLTWPGFEENAHLAIAACAFRLSQQDGSQKPQEDAEDAVRHFKSALDMNPQNKATKDNLNTAKLNLKTIRRKLKEQQQQQGSGKNDGKDNGEDNEQQQQQNGQGSEQQKQQQNSDQDKDSQEQQKKDLENLEQQQRQAQKDLQDTNASQQDLEQQQKNLEKQSKDAMDKQQQKNSGDSQQNKKAEDFMKESHAKQQEARKQLEQNNREQAQQAQKDAADLTRMARQALEEHPKDNPNNKQEDQQPQQQEDQQPQQQKDQQPQQQKDQQPQQQKDQQPQQQEDARAIDAINQENLNRLNRQRRSFNAPAAKNKDW